MKRAIVAGVFLFANVAGPVMADCGTTGHVANLSEAAIISLLSPGGGVYACYNPGTGRQNNETLLGSGTGGTFQEYHMGGATVQNEGNWIIGTFANSGTIAYAYSQGGTLFYFICSDNSGSNYHFVNENTDAVLNITISTGPGTC